jgi:rhomboid protease GluP
VTEPSEAAVRTTLSERRADEWALVLASQGIEHRIEPFDEGLALIVGWEDVGRAHTALAAYDEESRPAPAPEPLESFTAAGDQSLLGAAVALALLAFHAATGSRGAWLRSGSAAADLLLHGEWWRAATALTLHADLAHVAGNAAACLVFITAVGRWLGPGAGAVSVLLAGVLGNLATALVAGPHHDSIGASTATFGALGLLVARGIAERRRGRFAIGKPWVVAAAALALFGLLGVSKGSDVLAHLFGLAAGSLLGAIALFAFRKPLPRLAQWPLALAALGALAGCWWMALRSPGS